MLAEFTNSAVSLNIKGHKGRRANGIASSLTVPRAPIVTMKVNNFFHALCKTWLLSYTEYFKIYLDRTKGALRAEKQYMNTWNKIR